MAAWSTFAGARSAPPKTNPDVVLPLGFGMRDIAPMLQLNDE